MLHSKSVDGAAEMSPVQREREERLPGFSPSFSLLLLSLSLSLFSVFFPLHSLYTAWAD